MPAAPSAEPFIPDAPFKYVGGDVAVDFVNTVNWTDRGPERDRLSDYDRLLEWTRGAGVTSVSLDRRLRQQASADPQRAAAAFRRAVTMRGVLQRLFTQVVDGRTTGAMLEEFNTLLGAAGAKLRLERGAGSRLGRKVSDAGDPLDWTLWSVVWAASELLASPEVERLKACAGDDCGWFYVDRSRNGMRRWCEMEVCGMTEKNRRRPRSR